MSATAPSEVRRAFRYRLDPTAAQAERLTRWLDMARDLWNACLEQRFAYLQGPNPAKRYLRLFGPDGQQAMVAAASGQLPPDYAELPANVKQEITRRVDATFQRWYKRQGGRPRFQSWRRYESIIYESPVGWSITWDGVSRHGMLQLRKAGIDKTSGYAWEAFAVPIRIDQGLGAPAGEPRTLTVSRHAGRWWASISARAVPARTLPAASSAVGLDLRITRAFCVLSTGERIEPPAHYQVAMRHLAMCQRRVSRRKRGSNRREEAVRLLQRAHEHVASQRRDFHHQLAHELVSRYETIVVEDISPLFVVEKRQREHPGLAIAALDAGWSAFLTILRQKCAEYGRGYIVVPAMDTSRTCSGCGARHDPGTDAVFRCLACGLVLDVAVNAACTILRAGLETTAGASAA